MAEVLEASGPFDECAADRRPVWPVMAGLTLSLTGIGISGYLTHEHYTSSASLTCPASGGIVDCLKVTTSSYSEVGGIPVAVLGLVFFSAMLALQTPWAWRSHRRPVRAGRVIWSLAGVGTALWLIYAELFKLDAICLWCTAVHALTLLLFATTAFGTAITGGRS